MQQHYDILGISPGASVDEIKKAYRKLAKKYHPDVNRSMQASSRFVQIHESYNILLGKQTIQSPKEADYWDDYDEEYELRKKVWEYVKQQRLEKEQELQVTMNKLFYYFNLLLAAAFIFNLALIFDYSLPYDTVEDRFVKVSWAGSNGDQDDFDAYRKAGGEITLSTADHNYEINVSAGFGLQVADDETVITHTSIFNKVMSATATNFKNDRYQYCSEQNETDNSKQNKKYLFHNFSIILF